MTPLERLIRARIAAAGSLGVDDYMALALGHPEHGYYRVRDPLGAAGDFTTAPEVSQLFGEMIGGWLARVWLDQGAPDPFVLAELGPGRGTLMADALRAAAGAPGFLAAARLHLVETSPALRRAQAAALAAHRPCWLDRADALAEALPETPLLVVANEFFDALPVRQHLRLAQGWQERRVVIAGGRLAFGFGPAVAAPDLDRRYGALAEGTLVETSPAGEAIAAAIGRRIAARGGAGLVVDYGGWDGSGDTLQALARHAPADPLAAPGRADLTAHVQFRALAEAAGGGLAVHGPEPQGAFLERLGITLRARRLAAGQVGEALEAVVAGHRRLTHPEEMGHLFKAMALVPEGAPAPPGFGPRSADPLQPRRSAPVTLEILTSDLLAGARHGFFTRRGGASSGIYAGLNCGPGSSDQASAVAINRARAAAALGVAPNLLLSLDQVHSAEVAVAGPAGWGPAVEGRPRADAAVTAAPGVALSVLTADCAPVLLHDPEAGVIGAAHAGWRGALAGVLEATVAAMERLGAAPARVRAAVGPTISLRAYEVGPDFRDRFLAEDAEYRRFFTAGAGDRSHFDLPGFVLERLRGAGVAEAEWLGRCTWSDAARFYSYRRSSQNGEVDYGRLLSAIAL